MALLVNTAVGLANELQDARQLLLTGRYEEATETFADIESSAEQVQGLASCKIQQGDVPSALKILNNFLTKNSESQHAKIHGRIAQLEFERGNWEAAKTHVTKALTMDSMQPLAFFIQSELFRVTGQLDKAGAGYAQLSKLPLQSLSAEQAIWVGRAIAIDGRWKRNTRVFDRLVNEFYPTLLRREPNCWPAHLEIGKLFLEKYNEPEALRAIQAALAINPRAADIHLALGHVALAGYDFEAAEKHLDTAKKQNNSHLGVILARVDLSLQNQRFDLATELLKQARKTNPSEERTLGRLYAVYLRLDGLDEAPQSRATQLAEQVADKNSHCGQFYSAAAEAFEAMRIYPSAGTCYDRAIARLPNLLAERGKLGLVQMRLGEETNARKTLEEAFRLDPFNIRVKNTLEVLDLLNRYAVIETDHFIIRFDRGQDQLLAEYASRYLEETVYPDIVTSLGYKPEQKTLLEIFSRADGTSGHSWFSARMVGLPFIGTVGACAGKMFALTSPADGKPYNWARVLRHEFVHVVNLQQTRFQIPHWFTEALAVRNEGVDYPPEWDKILAKYVANDKLFNLTNINHGFTRPGSSERWTLAYYQAYLYADFFVELGGESALAKLLNQYALGASTPEAIREVVGKSTQEFEVSYRKFVAARAKDFVAMHQTRKSTKEWEQQSRQTPTDDVAHANLARIRFGEGKLREARRLAEKALATNESNSIAHGVIADLLFAVGEDERAWQALERGLASEELEPSLLLTAANRRLNEKQLDRAVEYFRRGLELQPANPTWIRGLARTYLAGGNDEELVKVLSQLAEREPDKVTLAKKLSQLTLRLEKFEAAEKWANRVIQVDVNNALAHAELGQALAGLGRATEAIREYETALRLAPGEPAWRSALKLLQK